MKNRACKICCANRCDEISQTRQKGLTKRFPYRKEDNYWLLATNDTNKTSGITNNKEKMANIYVGSK